MEDIILVGFGGHAKSVADTIETLGQYRIVGYTDVQEAATNYKYLGTDDCLKQLFDGGISNAIVSVGYMGNGCIRERLYDCLIKIGFQLPIIIDPSAIVSDKAIIEEGVFVGKGAVINSEATVKKMAIINTKAIIEHESVIGEFSHVAVGAVVCGQVNVGKRVLVGANSTIIQNQTIMDEKIVPAGGVIR